MHRRPAFRDRAAALTAAAVVACAGLGWAWATVASPAATMREIGAGSLHWFGLHRYDARLAVAGERFDPAQPFELDDWMYLVDAGTLLNRSTITKFGIRFAEITIAFRKAG